ncbi:hypothetical protein J6590_071599, partial [Homalodisca vitripennis]
GLNAGSFIDLRSMQRHHHTKHGLHFNLSGKHHLAHIITEHLKKTDIKKTSDEQTFIDPISASQNASSTTHQSLDQTTDIVGEPKVLFAATDDLSADILIHNQTLSASLTSLEDFPPLPPPALINHNVVPLCKQNPQLPICSSQFDVASEKVTSVSENCNKGSTIFLD